MKASIIIRAYNAEATLERAVKSAQAQQYPADAYEILVVDDGSTDGTATVALSFDDARIRIVRQENRGITEAGNVGIRRAEGDLIVFLDADDEAEPSFLSEATKALEDPSIDYAYGDYLEEYQGVTTIVRPSDPFKAPVGAFAWQRRKMASEGGFAGGTIFPEYELLLRTWGRWKDARISQPVFVYHRSQSSMTGDSSLVASSIKILREKYPERASEIARIRSYTLQTHSGAEPLTIRSATRDDTKLLFDWRNDRETQRASGSSAPLEWAEHEEWMNKVTSGRFPGRALYVVESAGERVGTVRSDHRDDGYTEVSYTVAPLWRGKGLGKRMVVQFVHEFLPGKRLAARIKKGSNPASEAIARALGLSPAREVPSKDTNEPATIEWR